MRRAGKVRVKLAPWPAPRAGRRQAAAQLAGGLGAGVESEAVAVGAGGETVAEKPRQIFGRDADPVVADGQSHVLGLGRFDREGDEFFPVAGFIDGLVGVANQIDQNLQHHASLRPDRKNDPVMADDDDGVAGQCGGSHAQRVVQQHLGGVKGAGFGGRGLLLRADDELLNVIEVGPERAQLAEQQRALLAELAAQRKPESWARAGLWHRGGETRPASPAAPGPVRRRGAS